MSSISPFNLNAPGPTAAHVRARIAARRTADPVRITCRNRTTRLCCCHPCRRSVASCHYPHRPQNGYYCSSALVRPDLVAGGRSRATRQSCCCVGGGAACASRCDKGSGGLALRPQAPQCPATPKPRQPRHTAAAAGGTLLHLQAPTWLRALDRFKPSRSFMI